MSWAVPLPQAKVCLVAQTMALAGSVVWRGPKSGAHKSCPCLHYPDGHPTDSSLAVAFATKCSGPLHYSVVFHPGNGVCMLSLGPGSSRCPSCSPACGYAEISFLHADLARDWAAARAPCIAALLTFPRGTAEGLLLLEARFSHHSKTALAAQ